MARDKDNIRDLFKRKFEHFEVQPSEKVWKKVRSTLYMKQFMQFRPGSFNIYYLSAVLITGLAILFIQSFRKDKDQDSYIEKNRQIEAEEIRLYSEETTSVVEKSNNHSVANTVINEHPLPDVDKDLSSTTQVDLANPHIKSTGTYSAKPVRQESEEENLHYIPEKSAISYFSVSAREGCVPLSVSFYNHSENSLYYSWSFGDGGISTEKNPSYIFDKPGTYFVNLTVATTHGDISTFTDSICVYPLPEVHFDFDSASGPGSNQPVYFYNYSQGAEYYLWDFGDGSTSNEKDPSHYYEHPGNYHIQLIAESINGCRDSMILKNVFSEKAPLVIFPNAFSPNRNGPSNGLYNPKDPNNDIFHPIVGEQLEEYQLKIFNRAGILIFESNDINIGWDGYYHQELLPQGVYVWKARGRFITGRTFVKMGDVTLIWKKER